MLTLEKIYTGSSGFSILGPTDLLFSSLVKFADSGYLKKDMVAFKPDSWTMTCDEDVIPSFIPKNFGHGSVIFEIPVLPQNFNQFELSKEFIKEVFNSDDHKAFLRNNKFDALYRSLRDGGLTAFSDDLANHFDDPTEAFRVTLNFYTNKDKNKTFVEFVINPDFKMHRFLESIRPMVDFIARRFRISNQEIPFAPNDAPIHGMILDYLKMCKTLWDKEASYLSSKLIYIMDSMGLNVDVPEFIMFRNSGITVTSQGNTYWKNVCLPMEDGSVLFKDTKSGLKVLATLNEYQNCFPLETEFDANQFSEATLLQPLYSVGIS